MPDEQGREVIGDKVSDNRAKATDPEWARHVMQELRGLPLDIVGSDLMAAIMRDAADVIEANMPSKEG